MLDPHEWQQDSSADLCGRCSSVFTLLRRRHHCRHCGGVFCSPCSEQRLWLRPWRRAESGGEEDAAAAAPAPPLAQRATSVTAQTSRAGGAAASAATNTTPGVATLSTFSSFASQTPRHADENSFLSEASVHGGASLGSVTSEPPSTSTAASGGAAAVLTPVVSPLTADVTAESRRCAAALPSSSSMSSAPPPQLPPRGQARRAHRAKVEAAAEGSRSSAVGLTSSSTEPDPQAEESTTLAAEASRANAATPGGERAVGGNGVGSRQASDALFAVSMCSVSPTTVAGETSPQTWTNYNNNNNNRSASNIAATSVSSPSWSHRGQGEVSGTSEALVSADAPGDEGSCPTSSRVVPFWQAARTSSTCSLPATGAVAATSVQSHSAVDSAAYVEASYRREVDAHHLVWYLCRVCVHCYDMLLDAILDAHEHTSPQLPQQAAQGRTQPLWQYVRLCSSAQSSRTRSGRRGSGLVGVDSPLTAPTRSSPSLSQSTPTRPLLSSAWARLCASVSLPATPVTPLVRTSPLVAAATADAITGDGCVLPPPALRPQDLRRAREAARQPQHSLPQLNSHQRPLPVTAECGKAPGVQDLAMRLSGAHPAANSTAANSTAAGESSRYSSPTSAEHLNEASVLSVSSAASLQLLSRQSTDATSPRQPQQARAVRSALTPPRRRLISIGKSSGHVRQAVAIARRRRRVAVLLVDEREVEADVVCSPFGSPLMDGVLSTPSFAAVAQALGASTTMATPVGTALPEGDVQSSNSGSDPSATASAKRNSRKSPPDGQRTNLRQGSLAGAVSDSKLPSLSIMVDFELENSTDAAAATLGVAQPLQQEEGCAVHGLCSGDWLRPFLPAEAAVTGPSMDNSFTMATTQAGGASPRVLPARDASLTPAHPTVAFTSRPISCAGGGATACTSSTPAQAPAQSGAPHLQQQQQSPMHAHLLPAVTVVPGSGACVLNALFRELGAAAHRATTPATPVLGALTPTASTAAAAAAAASSLFMDPTLSGSTSSSGWGTGPESYVAQRHALVREMVLRQHRSALLAAAAAAAAASSTNGNGGGGASSPGAGGLGSLSSLPFSAAAVAASGVAPAVGGVSHISSSNSGGGGGGHERVNAPVNVFFQLRSPTDTVAAFTTTTAASASSSVSVSVLPVTSQVELIGIPVDAATAPAATSPKSALSPTAACSSSRAGPTAQPVCGAPGASRPFTLTELLPQLAKLSTNLDGYVVIVLRCASRCGAARATTNISPPTAVNAAAASEESPLRGIAGAGVQRDKQQTAQKDDESRRERSVRLERDASLGSVSGGGTSSATFTRLDSAALQNSGSYSGSGGAAGTARRRRLSNNADASPHRRHRVTDFFGGPQLRLLYQQLQCCGVAQPAVSVIDVCDDGSAAAEEEEGSPGTVVADVGSPVANEQMNSAQTAAQESPAEAWHGSPLSPAAPSPLSSRSSSQPFLAPTRQRVPAAAASGTESSERRIDKRDALDKLLLPSSLNATREPSTSTVGTGADVTAASTTATVNNNNNTVSRRELQRRVAQEHAANSLRITAQQLGLPISRVHYPTRTTGNTERAADGANSGGSSGSGSSTASSAALLARGLESLVATMVYRDLSAQQQ